MSLVGIRRGKLVCDPLLMKESSDDIVDVLGTIVSAETYYLEVVTALNSGDEADKHFLGLGLIFEDGSPGATSKVINEGHQVLAFGHGRDVNRSGEIRMDELQFLG